MGNDLSQTISARIAESLEVVGLLKLIWPTISLLLICCNSLKTTNLCKLDLNLDHDLSQSELTLASKLLVKPEKSIARQFNKKNCSKKIEKELAKESENKIIYDCQNLPVNNEQCRRQLVKSEIGGKRISDLVARLTNKQPADSDQARPLLPLLELCQDKQKLDRLKIPKELVKKAIILPWLELSEKELRSACSQGRGQDFRQIRKEKCVDPSRLAIDNNLDNLSSLLEIEEAIKRREIKQLLNCFK